MNTKVNKGERNKLIEDQISKVERKPLVIKTGITTNKFYSKRTDKDIVQYRLTVPKEFAEKMKLNNSDFIAKFYLINIGAQTKPVYQLTAEIIRKNDEE